MMSRTKKSIDFFIEDTLTLTLQKIEPGGMRIFKVDCGSLKGDRSGYTVAQKVRKVTERLINDTMILPNGLRITARK